jgi:hypothetical protein
MPRNAAHCRKPIYATPVEHSPTAHVGRTRISARGFRRSHPREPQSRIPIFDPRIDVPRSNYNAIGIWTNSIFRCARESERKDMSSHITGVF